MPASVAWPIRHLSAMPDRYDPYRISSHSIKEPIWANNDFPMRQIRKFRYRPTRIGKLLESPKYFFGLHAKLVGSQWIVLTNILQPIKKLGASRRGKLQFHELPPLRRASASLNTLVRVCPSPSVISFSPTARSRNNSRSCSDFS